MKYYDNDGNFVREDGGTDVWEDVLGTTWEDFTEVIVGLYARERAKKSDADRNDILRAWFNTLARPDGKTLVPEGVKKFYSDPDGLYCRLMVYESGRNGIVQCRLTGGEAQCSHSEYQFAISRALSTFGIEEAPVYAMDHGAGHGCTSIALLKYGFHTTMYDYDTPQKKALMKAVGKFGHLFGLQAERLRMVDAGMYSVEECGKAHLVISQDVMEHVVDPVAEINKMGKMIVPGGLLLMGTFFNSCNGHDPQHLTENDLFQDIPLWFANVEKAGFKPIFNDQNGCLKVWEHV